MSLYKFTKLQVTQTRIEYDVLLALSCVNIVIEQTKIHGSEIKFHRVRFRLAPTMSPTRGDILDDKPQIQLIR